MASSFEEKTRKTFKALRVHHPLAVEKLFDEVQAQLNAERSSLVDSPPSDPAEREATIKALRDRWLARKNGLITSINENWLKLASPSLKPMAGHSFNKLRKLVTSVEINKLRDTMPPVTKAIKPVGEKAHSTSIQTATSLTENFDLTLPGRVRTLGSIHPVTKVQREIEDIFINLGFSIETGPEIETSYYNFEALNIPETHPARDDQDTLYVNAKTVLRTHTSPVQIRAMEKIKKPPLHIIVSGKVYRRDNADATHSPMFHQIEGLAINHDTNFADLKGVLDYFIKKFFGEKVKTSFHPSFFPFTEPSAEMSISCIFCDRKGLSGL